RWVGGNDGMGLTTSSMRYSLLLTSLVLASSSYPQFLDVESTVTKVEVYQGRAKVTRSFEVSIAPGATETIRFKSLPNSAHSDSIQLAVTEGPELYFGPLARYSVLEQADESPRLQELRAA